MFIRLVTDKAYVEINIKNGGTPEDIGVIREFVALAIRREANRTEVKP